MPAADSLCRSGASALCLPLGSRRPHIAPSHSPPVSAGHPNSASSLVLRFPLVARDSSSVGCRPHPTAIPPVRQTARRCTRSSRRPVTLPQPHHFTRPRTLLRTSHSFHLTCARYFGSIPDLHRSTRPDHVHPIIPPLPPPHPSRSLSPLILSNYARGLSRPLYAWL